MSATMLATMSEMTGLRLRVNAGDRGRARSAVHGPVSGFAQAGRIRGSGKTRRKCLGGVPIGVIVSFDQIDTVGAGHAALHAGWVVVRQGRFANGCRGWSL